MMNNTTIIYIFYRIFKMDLLIKYNRIKYIHFLRRLFDGKNILKI